MRITEEQWKEVIPLLIVHAKFKKINNYYIDESRVEDLVQATIEKAYKAQDRFDGRYLLAWLKTILNNTFIDTLGPLLEPMPDSVIESGAEGDQLKKIENQELYECIEKLQEVHREVFFAKSILGNSYKEISEKLTGPRSIGSLKQVYRRSFVQVQDCVKGAA